uniref:Uncharacterized protein n=1 Tax=Anopheles culicifacies TaxID=139723 RepID=A0A182MLS6_9DIPT
MYSSQSGLPICSANSQANPPKWMGIYVRAVLSSNFQRSDPWDSFRFNPRRSANLFSLQLLERVVAIKQLHQCEQSKQLKPALPPNNRAQPQGRPITAPKLQSLSSATKPSTQIVVICRASFEGYTADRAGPCRIRT